MFSRKMVWVGLVLFFFVAGCDVDQLLGKAKDKIKSEATKLESKEKEQEESSPGPATPEANFPDQFTIYYGPAQNALRVKKEGEGKWTATDAGKTLAVSVDTDNNVVFLEGDKPVAEGQLKEGKLKLLTPEKKFYLEVKFKEEKIKVFLAEGASESWDLKYKEDEQSGEMKVKVKLGEADQGKVKFDPAKGKLKVKDASDQEVAVSKEIGRLSAAPGVFLIRDLTPDQRDLLFLLLVALNK